MGAPALGPEASYAASFTDVVKDLDWKTNGIRVALALKYSPAPEPVKPPRYDTLIVRDASAKRNAPGLALVYNTIVM